MHVRLLQTVHQDVLLDVHITFLSIKKEKESIKKQLLRGLFDEQKDKTVM